MPGASVAEYKGLSREDGLGLAFTPVHRVVGGRCLTPVQPTSRSNQRALLQRARLSLSDSCRAVPATELTQQCDMGARHYCHTTTAARYFP